MYQSIVFLVIVILIVCMLVAFTEPIKISFTELLMTIAYNKGLDMMQQQGGLTPEIETAIKDFLERFGLDRSKITVNGTLAPVDWGDEIILEISYDKEYKEYDVENLVNIVSQTKTAQLVIDGATTSYFFDNN
ncbi:hypothetical protein [Caldisalinibacter kiritimatiensis]|uniref:DUF4845 domain-containing protein n=1 Tax=Caldisalinibacter kiritimatiensis TaxID=1304284 RepID=R1CRY0_9FIRM|nr:hypothetical protein [Caldisalinibacter kiritimatiensis]EOD01421.1 hypothetical protein L21TH_0468 [Caldisalinibacter kiritimatiensis]